MPADEPLTFRRGEVLAFIATFTAQEKWAPTRAEISRHFGWSTVNAADCHIKALIKKGYLAVRAGSWHKARSLMVVEQQG